MLRRVTSVAGALAAGVLLAPGVASAQSASANPLFIPPEGTRGAADPGVAVFPGGTFVASTGPATGPVRTTTDGFTWTDAPGPLFTKAPGWLRDRRAGSPQIYWLPEHKRYVVLFSGKGPHGKGCIGRGVSSTPYNFTNGGRRIASEGKRKTGYALECRDDGAYSLIDPSLFRDDDGRYYLLYKRNFGAGRNMTRAERRFRDRPQDIVIRPINSDVRTGLRSSKTLIAARRGTWEGRSVEAPTMIRRKGRYYLFYSGANYARESYGVGVAASLARDNRPNGTFKRFRGNPILTGSGDPNFCGVGHQDLYTPGDDAWLIFYHAYLGEPHLPQNGTKCFVKDRNGKTYRRFLMADQLRWDRRGGSPLRGDFWPSVNDGTPSGDGNARGRFVD